MANAQLMFCLLIVFFCGKVDSNGRSVIISREAKGIALAAQAGLRALSKEKEMKRRTRNEQRGKHFFFFCKTPKDARESSLAVLYCFHPHSVSIQLNREKGGGPTC